MSAQLLYDSDCGFCMWSVTRILRLDRGGAIVPLPIQSPEGDALLAGLSHEARLRSWHMVVDGRVESAGAAFPVLLRLLPHGARAATALARFPRTLELVYRLVADNRSRLSRLIPSASKR